MVPFRKEYLMLKPVAEVLVNQLSYLVPDINSSFIGVHFARLMGGEIEEGPKAVLAFKREGYNNRDFSLCDALDGTTYLGLM
jgi:L-2-hydroxyglutarate oxidase